MAAAGGGHDHLAAGLPHRPDHWRNQLPQRHRHRCARRHPDPGGCRRHRHYRQRPRQLGRQLWLPRQARPRRWIDDTVRALLEHLRHRRPAGQSRAGHCLRRPHRPRDGAHLHFEVHSSRCPALAVVSLRSDALCTFSSTSLKTGGTGTPISAAFSRMLPSSVAMYQVKTTGVNNIS